MRGGEKETAGGAIRLFDVDDDDDDYDNGDHDDDDDGVEDDATDEKS